MKTRTFILGIESSCDETAASVVVDGTEVLSNVIASQIDLHRQFGGVVPEIAARHHLELINTVIAEALSEAGIDLKQLNAVAVTRGPGLVGALLVGVATAKTLGYALDIPVIGVNHLEGHIFAVLNDNHDMSYPFIVLVISGGHTSLVKVSSEGIYETIGRTLDDAAGEAFDKIAKFLGLGYPGGPLIDRMAKQGDPGAFDFPRAMLHSGDYNFSLSGLKTAVINAVNKAKARGMTVKVEDVCASFQKALVDVQIKKTLGAAEEYDIDSIALTGGVAANSDLRQRLAEEAAKNGLKFFTPSSLMCTDNAAMIAAAAYHHYLAGDFLPLDADVDANLRI